MEERLPYKDPELNKRRVRLEQGTGTSFFLHRDLPLVWVIRLLSLGRSGIIVGLALVYFCILTKSRCVKLTGARLERLGISPDQKLRGLKQLKAAGLVDYESRPGKSPRISLLVNPGSKL